MPRRTETGVVISDKTAKTRRVEIPRLVRHPRYGKIMRRRTICYVHDEDNDSHVGDTVEIEEARPTSRMKRWRLLRVISRSREIDMAALKAARATADAEAKLGQE